MDCTDRRQERWLSAAVVAAFTLAGACSDVSSLTSGHHSHEGAEHKTAGGVHVQRVEAAGLRRRLPLALQLHRVKEPPPPPSSSPPSKEEGGMLNPATQDAHHDRHHHAPCPVIPVCLHFQRNQLQLDPNGLLSVELVQHFENYTCSQTHTHILPCLSSHLPLSCHPLSVRVKAS